jgi:hypothetical protein
MVVLDGFNFAELEPLDYKPVIFRFEYIGAPEREFMGSIVTREARHAGGNASYATPESARYEISHRNQDSGCATRRNLC